MDEAQHIARQAAALDDPRLCRESGGVTDAQDEALLPCPFCGTTEMLRRVGARDGDGWGFVRCDYCDAEGPDPDNLKSHWNTRADLARPSQAGDEMVAERISIALWREEAAAGTPSVQKRRNADTWADQAPELRDRWMRFARAALAAAPQPAGETVPCCICFKPCVTAEDGGPECELRDGTWTCSPKCYAKHPSVIEGDALLARGPRLPDREGLDAAYAAGQAEMRERAEAVAVSEAEQWREDAEEASKHETAAYFENRASAAEWVAGRISELPLKPRPK